MVVGVLAALFLSMPVLGLVVRAPWTSIVERLSRPGVGDAIRLSAICATASTVVVPPDPHLQAGHPYDPARIAPATREALLRVAGLVAVRSTRP